MAAILTIKRQWNETCGLRPSAGVPTVQWSVLLALAGGAVEAGMRRSRDPWYRAGVVAAAGGAFALVWANAAVGLIGGEDNPAGREKNRRVEISHRS